MANLIINKITYKGDSLYYQTPELTTGINILVGHNGNGKTTFMHLLYYGLSGEVEPFNPKKDNKVRHKEISKNNNDYVEVQLTINSIRYILRRTIGHNYISISQSGEEAVVLPITRTDSSDIFSDWLLRKLEIDILDVFQGDKTFKLNVRDLFRLIFHDQDLNPIKVFKKPDNSSFVSDSEYMRQVIFRVLVGKSYSEFYNALKQLKIKTSEKADAEGVFKEFEVLSNSLTDGEESLNSFYLKEQIAEKEEQLEKLQNTRENVKLSRPTVSDDSYIKLEELKSQVLEMELDGRNLDKKINNNYLDFSKYSKYKESLIREVTQLSKIIHSHESLSLFSEDTCPYCLGDVKRHVNQCFCGADIDEGQFERFFYSTEEYWDILKSRKKSLETVNNVISDIETKNSKAEETKSKIEAQIENYNSNLHELVDSLGNSEINIAKLDEIDDKILEVREEIEKLYNRLRIEEKLDSLRTDKDSKTEQYNRALAEKKRLEFEAIADMNEIVKKFNIKYNELMMVALKECKNARIDFEDYQPIIDGGIYREASSRVSIRLMYYLTLLHLSLSNEDVKFPRFLMIDTPRTAGIDTPQLIIALQQIAAAIPEEPIGDYQIILATGHDSYPPEFKPYIFDRLTDDDKLLKPIK